MTEPIGSGKNELVVKKTGRKQLLLLLISCNVVIPPDPIGSRVVMAVGCFYITEQVKKQMSHSGPLNRGMRYKSVSPVRTIRGREVTPQR